MEINIKRDRAELNPYGKSGDVTTKQIIDRVLRNFGSGDANKKESSEKTIGDMEDEILKEVHTRAQFIDFRK